MTIMYYKNASDKKEEDLTREYVDLTRITLPENHGLGILMIGSSTIRIA